MHNHQCAICGQQFVAGEETVPTTTGEYVHTTCANHQAQAAHRRRMLRAIVSAGLAVSLSVLAMLSGMHGSRLSILILLLLLGHILVNQRWWRLTMQSVRLRWWGRRGRR